MNTETQEPAVDSTDSTPETGSCSKSRFSATTKGALIGAALGSVLPVFGTISGAIIGGISGKVYEKKYQNKCRQS